MTECCDINDIKLSNYNFVNCSSHSKHTGGVCAFINKNIKHKNVTVIKDQIFWLLSFEIHINKVAMLFACVYLLSNNEHKQSTLDFIEKWLNDISANKHFILSGDFNIDMSLQTPYSRKLKNICDDNGAQLLVKSPTRITEESATIIDLVITNICTGKVSCQVLTDDQISDHSIIEIIASGKSETQTQKERKIRLWQNYNVTELWNSLENSIQSWGVVNTSDINTKTNWLINIYSHSFFLLHTQ